MDFNTIKQAYVTDYGLTHGVETTKRVSSQLNKFGAALQFQKIVDLEDLTIEALERIASALQGNMSAYAVYGLLLEARKFLAKTLGAKKNPFRKFHLERPPQPIRYAPNENEVFELLDKTIVKMESVGTPLAIRNALMVRLQYACGLRSKELRELKLVNLQGERINVIGKNKERMVPVDAETHKLIGKYLRESRPTLLGEGVRSAFLFVSCIGNPLGRATVADIMKRQVGTAITGYELRHAFATGMAHSEEGCDTLTLAHLMGHTRLATLEHYVNEDAEHLRKVKEQRHPLAKKMAVSKC